jgi:hypothetical protein
MSLALARAAVEELTLVAARASNAVLAADENCPLAPGAAASAAVLQRLTAERIALDGEEARARARLKGCSPVCSRSAMTSRGKCAR